MPEIVFDGRKITVDPNTNLVEAGLKAGVPVPVFCYHKDLGAVGSCRVCAVTVKQDGKTRTVMGCMTAALDGMEVTTLDAESVALRKHVVEWLMISHPHDCPICDEGGECQLQDLTIASGHSQRVYDGAKRTFKNQFLGEFIVHEMNRCIACYRCSRFYQEYAGGRDFGVSGSRDRVYFGRHEDGPFESPFSGNLVEMCPTGVFTDKLFRYKSRVWDLEIAPSVCPHCSVGCNLLPGARHRMLQRVRVRENPAVNGAFLCDRGQFGHQYVMAPDRPRHVTLRGQASTWEESLGLAGGDLLRIARTHGASTVAFVASSRASVETHGALETLAEGPLAGARVAHFDDVAREVRALAGLAALRAAGCPPLDQGDIGGCDVLVVAGTSLVDEAPLAALAARQVVRSGGKLFVLNAGERYLDSIATACIHVHPAQLAATLTELAAKLGSGGGDGLGAVAAALKGAARPGIIVGSDLMDGPAFEAAAALAGAMAKLGTAPRFGCLFPGPNGFGAAALSKEAGFGPFLADLEAGKLKAAVIAECDARDWPKAALDKLKSLELLVVLDHLPGPLRDAAAIFLPTDVTYESHGSFVNRAGRLQAFAPARVPGRSVIELIDDQANFPRTPRLEPPDGEARMTWQVLEALREYTVGKPGARALRDLRGALSRSSALWGPLATIEAGSDGAPLNLEANSGALGSSINPVPAFQSGSGLAAFRMDRTLGSEILSSRSEPMMKMAGPPRGAISTAEAKKLGIEGVAKVAFEAGGHTLELEVAARPDVMDGVLLVPRDAPWPSGLASGTAGKLSVAAMVS